MSDLLGEIKSKIKKWDRLIKFYFEKTVLVRDWRKIVVLSLQIDPSFEKIWLAQEKQSTANINIENEIKEDPWPNS